jgi:dephospho-CoA kinase
VQVIGITGTLGAGKGTIVDYLTANHGYNHISVRSLLQGIIAEKGMPDNRDSMSENRMQSK